MRELVARRASVAASIAQSKASLIEAQSSAGEAGRVAGRNEELAAQGTIPRATADEATASAEAASARVPVAEQGIASAQAEGTLVEAQIASLALQIARTEVRAPVAGLVVGRNAQVGAIASAAADPMFTLVRDGAMEMRAEVSERDLLRVAAGQAVTLSPVGAAEPLTGTVRLVEPSIDLETRLGRARILIDDPVRVVEGMFLTAEILVAEAEVLAVPVTAVGTGSDGSTVMRVRDGAVERLPVVTGIRDGSFIGVSRGYDGGSSRATSSSPRRAHSYATATASTPSLTSRPRPWCRSTESDHELLGLVDPQPDRADPRIRAPAAAGLAVVQGPADHAVPNHRRAHRGDHRGAVGRGAGRARDPGHAADRGRGRRHRRRRRRHLDRNRRGVHHSRDVPRGVPTDEAVQDVKDSIDQIVGDLPGRGRDAERDQGRRRRAARSCTTPSRPRR